MFLIVTMPHACWFLWRANYIEDFSWRLRFQFGSAFWRFVLREVYFEGPNCVWRALKTSILNIDCQEENEVLCRATSHEPRAMTVKLWGPQRKCPKAIPTHLQNHAVWSRILNQMLFQYISIHMEIHINSKKNLGIFNMRRKIHEQLLTCIVPPLIISSKEDWSTMLAPLRILTTRLVTLPHQEFDVWQDDFQVKP